ncbi:PTS transporter subunit EIIC [Spiroplasma clarkii]|uniref:PTS transporter subunit EIIC n=1 Tax=Spiroplasma clarkii TaxID=2139 RepID=UPI0011BAA6F2|nr:PTS transporter subunit EIIC [Spiroplasma clarkii]
METEKLSKPSKFRDFGKKALDFVQKITQSTFVSTIMESFILVMPLVITSTIFILAAELAPSFGFEWKDDLGNVTNQGYAMYSAFCWRMYNLSYGILGLALTIALTSRLTEKIGPRLQSNRKMNVIVVCISATVAYLLFSIPNTIDVASGTTQVSALDIISALFGAKGIFVAMLTGLTVPWVFYLCYKFNITIRLPKQVPQNISQAFLNIFPLIFTIIIYGILGWVFIEFLGDTMLSAIFNALTPLLEGAKSYWFFIAWGMVLSLTWFCGIHTSVWAGITDTLAALGVQENVELLANGEQATNLWPGPFSMGAYSMGGSGAQIAVPFIILLFCKSKQLNQLEWWQLCQSYSKLMNQFYLD